MLHHKEYLTHSSPKMKESEEYQSSEDGRGIFNKNKTALTDNDVRIRTSKEFKFSKMLRQRIESQEPNESILNRIGSFDSETD